jgi:hypothetical protein
MRIGLFALAMASLCGAASALSIADLSTWTLNQDPAHPGMTALPVSSVGAPLNAFGPVPSGTDIGYASVDGSDVANSSKGYYFDPATSFHVAIDFALLTRSTTGGAGIGFGIGEDAEGLNSAGVGLGVINGQPIAFSTAGRIGDVDQPLQLLTTAPLIDASSGGAINRSSGRLFVEYDSATKDVTLGVSTTPGAAAPSETQTLSAIGAAWNGDPLLVSLFLRSQSVSVIPPLQGGFVGVTFSNFEVLSGTPITIPEPTTTVLAALALFASWRFQRTR